MAIQVNTSVLEAALNNGLSGWLGNTSSLGRFPQVSGLRYSFDPSLPEDARLVAAEVAANGTWVPLSDFAGPIMLLSTDYITKGGDFYDVFASAPVLLDSSKPLNELLAAYLAAQSPVAPTTDGRIVNCADSPAAPLCAGAGGSSAPAPAPAGAAAARKSSRRLRF